MIKKMIRLCFAVLCAGILAAAVGCKNTGSENPETTERTTETTAEKTTEKTTAAEISFDGEERQIWLKNSTAEASADGVNVDEGVVTISKSGTYRISGTLAEGQLVVDAGDDDNVILVFEGVDIRNAADAAFYVKNADNTTIYLVEGTDNFLISGTETEITAKTAADEEASGGALYSKDDLVIDGAGKLTVGGYINNAVHCNDDLTIRNGEILIYAVNNGIKGKDSVEICGGTIEIAAGNDGIKSDNDTDEGKGNISVNDGTLRITANDDGISAYRNLTVYGGTITVLMSYEGLEANQIEISGGKIDITAADDGINANGGSSGWGFLASSAQTSSEEMPNLIIRGGSIHVNAGGDGLDSNGNLIVEGGTVVIAGPTDNGNGAIDYGMESGGKCTISGGVVLALGSSSMAESFGEDSSQCSVRFYCASYFATGDMISIQDAQGNAIYSYEAEKGGNCIIFSSPELKQGEQYTFSVGDEETEVVLAFVCTDAGSSAGAGGGGFGGFGGQSGGHGGEPHGGQGGLNGGHDGRRPEEGGVPSMSEGETPPEMPEGGNFPSMPEGETPPQMPKGGTP